MKNLLLLFGFFCLSLPAFAQFSVGLSAGVNYSDLKWQFKNLPEVSPEYEPAIGFRVAAMGAWQMSPMFALRAEFGTQVRSSKGDIEFSNEQGESLVISLVTERFQSWEGGLLFQVSPFKSFKNAYFIGGCTASRLTKHQYKAPGLVLSADFENDGSLALDKNTYNLNSFAADLGLGWNIPLGVKNQLKLEARYQYGLKDFSSHQNIDARFDPLIVSVGYLHKI